MTAEDDTQDKKRYAAALLARHDGDPYLAALDVFPGDISRAMAVSRDWPNDPTVAEYIQSVPQSERDEMGVPTKNDIARKLWGIVEGAIDKEIAIKAAKELRELLYGGDKGTTINNNTLVDQRKVMVVTDHGTNAEWEAKLLKQQAALTHDGAQPAVN